MNKLIILLFVAVSSTLAVATESSQEYDSFMMDCLDYGHSHVSEEQFKACQAEAKEKGLVAGQSKAPVASAPATSTKTNQYDLIMMDCLDYGHSHVSDEQVKACRAEAKETVLSTQENQFKFLDCIDYNHGTVTEEREISCLREISELN